MPNWCEGMLKIRGKVMYIDKCPYADNVGMCKKCISDWLQSEAE